MSKVIKIMCFENAQFALHQLFLNAVQKGEKVIV